MRKILGSGRKIIIFGLFLIDGLEERGVLEYGILWLQQSAVIL
jgi:hypothetical protein